MIKDLSKVIKEYTNLIKDILKTPNGINHEKEILEIEEQRYNLIYYQIHSFLSPKKNAESEKQILELIRDINNYDKKICENKVNKFIEANAIYKKRKQPEKIELCNYYLNKWLILYENFYALISYRSLEHFAQFMEWDKKENKVWKDSIDPYGDGGYTGVNKPFFYFFTKMVTQKKIKFISKQMPTGIGKSYSNQFAFAWLLGIDCDNDILDVLGNPTLVTQNTKGTVDIMRNYRYAMVFPQYNKYLVTEKLADGTERKYLSDNMFSICKIGKGELTLADSSKPFNLKIISKDTSIDGIRIKYLFLDDVCRSKDANNLRQHEEDIKNYWNSWWKRNYNTNDFYIVVGGTAYSVHDILSHLILYYSEGKMIRTTENKYTYHNENGNAIFIKIPKIDFELYRSTYPQKFPLEEALKIRDRDLKSFLAMEQQEPQNPETSPLCFEKLVTYDYLPDNLSEGAYACLDPARSGKNYVSMPIHRIRKEFDKYGVEIEKHYFVDCLYQLETMDKMYSQICDKVENHYITKLHIENNTDTSLKFLLDKMLHERGIMYCEITEKFTSENKEDKIAETVYNSEGIFKNVMVYPSIKAFAPSSEVGTFMRYLTSYDYEKKLDYDDAIDSECMYIEKFVQKKKERQRAKLLYV